MSIEPAAERPIASGRQNLHDAALSVIGTEGYAAATLDGLCAEASLAKGSFFHHFKNKEAFGVAAAEYRSETTGAFFAAAPYHRHADPLDLVLGYIDFRKDILAGKVPEFTCFVGTMVQEVYETPDIRDACDASISGHAVKVAADIAAAMKRHGIRANCNARSLAVHTQAVLQGTSYWPKPKDSADGAAASVDHLRRYVELLFRPAMRKGKETP